MPKKCLMILALLAVSISCTAQERCPDRPECWPEGSAMHTGLLLAQKQRAIEKRMADEHENLVKLVAEFPSIGFVDESRLLNALRTQQAGWLKYRAEECELVGSLTGSGGNWPSTYAGKCEVNHSVQRLRRIRSAIRCIKKIPNEKRSFGQNNCLQQLAPLTNK